MDWGSLESLETQVFTLVQVMNECKRNFIQPVHDVLDGPQFLQRSTIPATFKECVESNHMQRML